jgi:mRNA interferase MazF
MNSLVYPLLQAGAGNLRQNSVVLLDQVRAIDARRIAQYIGKLDEEAYLAISVGITQIFG